MVVVAGSGDAVVVPGAVVGVVVATPGTVVAGNTVSPPSPTKSLVEK